MSSQISDFSSKLCCRMSAKWLYGKQYILHCCSASQYYHTTFHSVNTEQYGTTCCLTLTAGGALCVSLIWRRPALKIVVLMLQYQTIDRNIFFSFLLLVYAFTKSCVRLNRSLSSYYIHQAYSPTCSVQSECFFVNSWFRTSERVVWKTIQKHKIFIVKIQSEFLPVSPISISTIYAKYIRLAFFGDIFVDSFVLSVNFSNFPSPFLAWVLCTKFCSTRSTSAIFAICTFIWKFSHTSRTVPYFGQESRDSKIYWRKLIFAKFVGWMMINYCIYDDFSSFFSSVMSSICNVVVIKKSIFSVWRDVRYKSKMACMKHRSNNLFDENFKFK